MDLSKSKFQVIKTPTIIDLGSDTIEFLNYQPETDHLSRLGSGQYSVQEGAIFASNEEDDDDEYENILNKYDPTDPLEQEKAYSELESKGFVRMGDAVIVDVLKAEEREPEYCLILNLPSKFYPKSIVVLATSTNRLLLKSYMEMIDNPITRFKLGLILDAHPERVIAIEDFYGGFEVERMECEQILQKLDLI